MSLAEYGRRLAHLRTDVNRDHYPNPAGPPSAPQADPPALGHGDEPPPAARDQGFRRAVVFAYDHRCALCGIRMVTPDAHTAIEACHIVPWSVSRDDDPRNGPGLCRLCHWAFDEGLLALANDYSVLASRQLSREPNLPAHLTSLAGRLLLGPGDQRLWPSRTALGWHRAKTFRAR